mgnify:CR=1 FL=1
MMSIDPGFGWPDWRATVSYGYTNRLTRRQWAWEFLRRNPTFRRDLADFLQNAEIAFLGESVQIVRSTANLSQWCVLFRELRKRRCDRILVS